MFINKTHILHLPKMYFMIGYVFCNIFWFGSVLYSCAMLFTTYIANISKIFLAKGHNSPAVQQKYK